VTSDASARADTIAAVTEPTRTRLYLVRHCDVRNPGGVLYGHMDGFPLSERGVAQAEALGRFFADTPVRHIFTSPLERARQTADIIASHVDHVPVDVCDSLTEARFGRYIQGVRPKQVPLRRPLWFIHMMWPGALPNDESVPEMAARVRQPLERLLDEFPGSGGVCISHGDPIQAFWVAAEGRPHYALHRLQCAKGGLLELDYRGRRLESITYRAPAQLGAPPAAAGDGSHP
jgi:broad specificity phosphatase PhoE